MEEEAYCFCFCFRVVEVLGRRPGDLRRLGVEPGHDPGEDLVDVGLLMRLVGELGEEPAGGVQVLPVDEEPVGRAGRQRGGPGHRVQVGRGLQVCGDAAQREDVQQVFTHPWVDVAGRGVRGSHQSVVPPSPAGTARGHPASLCIATRSRRSGDRRARVES
jgi:hypothetical protein